MIAIFFRTLLIYILLSLAMRWMGKRQIGELEVSELVATLLISELAALPVGDPDLPLLNAVIPICVLVSLEVLISAWKQKSQKAETLLDGDPVYLIYKGRIRQKKLEENRISLGELLAELRQQGVGRPEDVAYCILEANGKTSVLKKSDLGENGLAHVLIADGRIRAENLEALAIDEERLDRLAGGSEKENICLLTLDDAGNVGKIMKE